MLTMLFPLRSRVSSPESMAMPSIDSKEFSERSRSTSCESDTSWEIFPEQEFRTKCSSWSSEALPMP